MIAIQVNSEIKISVNYFKVQLCLPNILCPQTFLLSFYKFFQVLASFEDFRLDRVHNIE